MMAQDILSQIPEAAVDIKSGAHLRVDYMEILPLLVEATNDLEKMLTSCIYLNHVQNTVALLMKSSMSLENRWHDRTYLL